MGYRHYCECCTNTSKAKWFHYKMDSRMFAVAELSYAFDIESNEFTQVLHNGHGHWMTISTVGAREAEVLVYDSLYPSVSSCVKRQVAALLNKQ